MLLHHWAWKSTVQHYQVSGEDTTGVCMKTAAISYSRSPCCSYCSACGLKGGWGIQPREMWLAVWSPAGSCWKRHSLQVGAVQCLYERPRWWPEHAPSKVKDIPGLGKWLKCWKATGLPFRGIGMRRSGLAGTMWGGTECRGRERCAVRGPLYSLVQPLLQACHGIFTFCFPGAALQLSSCPGCVQLLKTKSAESRCCQAVRTWKSRCPQQVLTCLVTHQHPVRPDASAGFRCVLLITHILSAGMPVARCGFACDGYQYCISSLKPGQKGRGEFLLQRAYQLLVFNKKAAGEFKKGSKQKVLS